MVATDFPLPSSQATVPLPENGAGEEAAIKKILI